MSSPWYQPLRADEIAQLARNIASPNGEVACQSLRTCVRLSLTQQAWRAVAGPALDLVRRISTLAPEQQEAVVDNAARIPSVELRDELVSILRQSGLSQMLAVKLRAGLARSGDARVLASVLSDLQAPDVRVRRAAARDLAGLRALDTAPVAAFAEREEDPGTKFWLTLSLALNGEAQPLVAFLETGKSGDDDWGITYYEEEVEYGVLEPYARRLDAETIARLAVIVPGEGHSAGALWQLAPRSRLHDDYEPTVATQEDQRGAEKFVAMILADRTDFRNLFFPSSIWAPAYEHLPSRVLGRAAVRLFEQQFIHLTTRADNDSSRFASPTEPAPYPHKLFYLDGGEIMAYSAGAMLRYAEGVDPRPLFHWYLRNASEPVYTGIQLAAAASYATPREVLLATREALSSADDSERVAAAMFIELARRYDGLGIPTWGGGGPPPDVLCEAAADSELEIVRCDPEVSAPSSCDVGEEIAVRIGLSMSEHQDASVRIETRSGWETLLVDTHIVAVGADLLSRSCETLALDRRGSSSSVDIRLRTASPQGVEVVVLFSYRGTPCGWHRIHIPNSASVSEAHRSGEGVAVNLNAVAPDLTLWFERVGSDKYACTVLIPEEFRSVDAMPDEVSALLYLESGSSERMRSTINAIAADSISAGRAMLRGLGDVIFDELPAPMRAAYEALSRHLGDGFTIQFLTDDPGVPWEFARPLVSGRRTNLLCETHPIARWSWRNRATMSAALNRAGDVVCIAPHYDKKPLPRAKEERTWADAELGAECTDVMSREQFVDLLSDADAPIALLHIAAHASFFSLDPLLARLHLTEDSISAAELRGSMKVALAGAFVFLNACEAGAWGAHLGGTIAGLASAFLENGASAVVAPLWSVDDKEALELAQRLLVRVWKGEPLARVLRDARHAESGSVDALAYILWGDVRGAFPERTVATVTGDSSAFRTPSAQPDAETEVASRSG